MRNEQFHYFGSVYSNKSGNCTYIIANNL